MKIKLDKGAYMPTRAHATDAGLDIYTPKELYINATTRDLFGEPIISSCIVDTGVHIAIPEGYVGFIKSKSGLNVKKGLIAEGVIDSGYTGSIVVKLYNLSDKCHAFAPGEKIAQLVLLPIITPTLELVNSLEETERGDNGFGSTGK